MSGKRMLSIVLSALLVVGACPLSVQAEQEETALVVEASEGSEAAIEVVPDAEAVDEPAIEAATAPEPEPEAAIEAAPEDEAMPEPAPTAADAAADATPQQTQSDERVLSAQYNGNGGEVLVLGDPIGGSLSSATDKNLYYFELPTWGYITIGWSNQYHASARWDMRLEDATYGSASNYIAKFSWGNGINNVEESQVSQRIGLPPGTYALWVSTTKAGYAKNVNYAFSVDYTSSARWEREPVNDTISGATSAKIGSVYRGTMLSPTDTDVYAFRLAKPQAMRIKWSNAASIPGIEDGNPTGSVGSAIWSVDLYGSSGKLKSYVWGSAKTAARYSTAIWLPAGQYYLYVGTKGKSASNFTSAQYALSVRASCSLAWAKVGAIKNQGYTGSAIKPRPVVRLGGKKLTRGKDYVLSYANNVKRGTASVTITGIGAFTGSKTVSFKIVKGSIKKATIAAIPNQTYTGSAITPKLQVRMAGTLTEGTSYTLSYANNVKRGTATVTIKGKGNYTGTKKVTFKIV